MVHKSLIFDEGRLKHLILIRNAQKIFSKKCVTVDLLLLLKKVLERTYEWTSYLTGQLNITTFAQYPIKTDKSKKHDHLVYATSKQNIMLHTKYIFIQELVMK